MKEKLYNSVINIYLVIKYAFINTRRFFIKLRIKLAKNHWFISKNRNFYNPTFEATVYKYNNIWLIARYGRHFGSFERKEDAMNEIFQIWLKDKKFTEIINKLEEELSNIKHKIRNIYDGTKYSNEKKLLSCEKSEEEGGNLRAEHFYLIQTHTNCYKCKESTLISAIVLPDGFEAIDVYAIEDLENQQISAKDNIPFCRQDYLSIISYVTYISPNALKEIYLYINNSLFQKKYSAAAGYSYYRSICAHCGTAQGDNFVILEIDSPFHPLNVDRFKEIKFHKKLKFVLEIIVLGMREKIMQL